MTGPKLVLLGDHRSSSLGQNLSSLEGALTFITSWWTSPPAAVLPQGHGPHSHISLSSVESHLHPVSTWEAGLLLASDPVDCSRPSPASGPLLGAVVKTLSSSHQGWVDVHFSSAGGAGVSAVSGRVLQTPAFRCTLSLAVTFTGVVS